MTADAGRTQVRGESTTGRLRRVLLTLSTTREPATDLGYLLHKHPSRVQGFGLPVGRAHVFYPEATAERCTVALLVEVDPVALVRGRGDNSRGGFALGQYVNDRPYAASSLLAVAVKRVFATAMTGRCDSRAELAAGPIPLEITLPAVPCGGDVELLRRLFVPLGWEVDATIAPLDPHVKEWGVAPYADLRLTGDVRLADALNQLYVLLPVLDDSKHYWVGDEEIDKLLRAGHGWLADHPEREVIASRFLKHQRTLTASAMTRLSDSGEVEDPEPAAEVVPSPLSDLRRRAVLQIVAESGARRVGDFGCGEGSLVAELMHASAVEHIIGVDVSVRSLRTAARRLRLDTLPQPQRDRIQLFQSALTYRDDRLIGLD
ncbi:MAG: 3' terminal RNA ribose 2'-O-methyltransferase Hen1, partial [Allobranchiibius sp.]